MAAANGAPGRAVTVLNVEDDAGTRLVRSRMLELAGYRAVDVETAAEARAAFVANPPDVVLLDLHLPDEDGFALCEEFKSQHPTVPVVMITSVYRTTDARRDGFALGADAFLLEPVDGEQLLRVIAALGRGEALDDETRSWILTTSDGRIVDLSPTAAARLNLSPRGSVQRNLLSFFPGHWVTLQNALARASGGEIVHLEATLRPRDRRPLAAHLEIAWAQQSTPGTPWLRWVLRLPAPTDPVPHGRRRTS